MGSTLTGRDDRRKIAICVTISEWLYNAIQASEILTLNPAYFELRKPLERRMYEIARKHVGRQGIWEIGLETLRSKCGSTVERTRQFRAEVSKIAATDKLPDYRVMVTTTGKVCFISRDPAQVAKRLAKAK
jgi:plasmid replication initiation protein